MAASLTDRAQAVGRYLIGGMVASGGMASIHLGQMRGALGFSRTVAIKRMHEHLTTDPDFVSMFIDEARLAARIRHPNVVSTLDVVLSGSALFIVMEYVHGATLAYLLKRAQTTQRIPERIVLAIVRGTLHGLHAAHEAVGKDGRPLGIVHRDVSPHNVIVGTDGAARVLDFGIAKANVRLHETREGILRGKLSYMAPEQLDGAPVGRASDIFATSVVLWEALTAQPLYAGANEGQIAAELLRSTPRAPSVAAPELGTKYDALVARGLSRDPKKRFETAREMAIALGDVGEIASDAEVGEWLVETAAELLQERATRIREFETLLHDASVVAIDESDTTGAVTIADSDETAPAMSESRQMPTAVLAPQTPRRDVLPSPVSTMPSQRRVAARARPAAAQSMRVDNPRREIFHAFPATTARCKSVVRVRSTLLTSAIVTLRERRHLEKYMSSVDPDVGRTVLATIAGGWLSADVALEHYAACERLSLPSEESFAIGAAIGERIQKSVLKTITRLAQGLGANPWTVFAQYERLWARMFDGGGFRIYKIGPKEAVVELIEIPFARLEYFQSSFRGVNWAGLSLFASKVYVRGIRNRASAKDSFETNIAWA